MGVLVSTSTSPPASCLRSLQIYRQTILRKHTSLLRQIEFAISFSPIIMMRVLITACIVSILFRFSSNASPLAAVHRRTSTMDHPNDSYRPNILRHPTSPTALEPPPKRYLESNMSIESQAPPLPSSKNDTTLLDKPYTSSHQACPSWLPNLESIVTGVFRAFLTILSLLNINFTWRIHGTIPLFFYLLPLRPNANEFGRYPRGTSMAHKKR